MALNIATATRAYPGETQCGDACSYWVVDNKAVFAVSDGLGHGSEAAQASIAAIQCIDAHLHESCTDIFTHCDRALRNTRGAALAIASLDLHTGQLTIGTVGNIRALLLRAEKDLRLGGARGIVGAGFGLLKPENIQLRSGDILTLFTDGFDEFPPIRQYIDGPLVHPEHVLEQVIAELSRPNDDAGILLYQHS